MSTQSQKVYGVARWVALGVAALITASLIACLSLFPEASLRLMMVGALLCFAATFLILYTLFVFVLLRELNQLETAFKKIRRQNYTFVYRSPKGIFHLLNPLRDKMLDYVRSQAIEMEELRKLSQFRREFLADVSHELKTPLFAAQGFIDTLLDEETTEVALLRKGSHKLEKAKEEESIKIANHRRSFLRKASRNLDKANHMLRDLMTTARMESGAIQMQFESVNIYALAKEQSADFETLCKQKNVSLVVQKKPTHKRFLVRADKHYLRQVLANLIKNAIQYNYKGGRVRVSFTEHPKSITVSVSDTGKGIPRKDLPRIFERFYRVDKSRSQQYGGTGIGLALVKHILEAHNSKPEVSTKRKTGSTFSFDIEKYPSTEPDLFIKGEKLSAS